MVDRVISLPAQAPFEDIERRYLFAAWPQACAHPSWLDGLDAAVGMKLSRAVDERSGTAEQAVAQALLRQLDARMTDRVAVDRVPAWAMERHDVMRLHLSTVAALGVLPALKLSVSGADARQWDVVLGMGVRHSALRMCRANPQIAQSTHASGFFRSASLAAKASLDWDRFCLSMGLTALAECGAAVCARVRLAWPVGFQHVEPLAVGEADKHWIVATCMAVAQWLAVDQAALCEVAA